MNEDYKSITDTERERETKAEQEQCSIWLAGSEAGGKRGQQGKGWEDEILRKLVGPKRSLEVQKHQSKKERQEETYIAGKTQAQAQAMTMPLCSSSAHSAGESS